MNEIFLDTETTGLSFRDGHKILEIACIETKDLIPTGNFFHKLINPKRNVPEEAFKVHGFSYTFLKDKGTFDQDLIRYEGSKKVVEKSKTTFKVIDKNSNCTLLEMNPITGRKHQLRKQLSMIGHPVYGDDKYTFNKDLKTKNKDLMLHSYKVRFIINKKKYTYKALLPDYFKKLIKTKRLNLLS